MRGHDDRPHAERHWPLIVLTHAVAHEKRAVGPGRDRVERRQVYLWRRRSPPPLARKDDAIEQVRESVAPHLPVHHLRGEWRVREHAAANSVRAEPTEHA